MVGAWSAIDNLCGSILLTYTILFWEAIHGNIPVEGTYAKDVARIDIRNIVRDVCVCETSNGMWEGI